jgi:hypothetical protein
MGRRWSAGGPWSGSMASGRVGRGHRPARDAPAARSVRPTRPELGVLRPRPHGADDPRCPWRLRRRPGGATWRRAAHFAAARLYLSLPPLSPFRPWMEEIESDRLDLLGRRRARGNAGDACGALGLGRRQPAAEGDAAVAPCPRERACNSQVVNRRLRELGACQGCPGGRRRAHGAGRRELRGRRSRPPPIGPA